MNFYDVLAAEKWGGGIPTINFFDLLFAQSMGGGEQWETYEGTLPATIISTGDDMKQYQVYGATGGVGTWDDMEQSYKLDMGVKSGNLLDYSTVQNNLTLRTNGFPYSYDGRIATLTPIDVSTVSAVTITYNSNYGTILFVYSVLAADDTMLIRESGKQNGDTIEIPTGGVSLYIGWYRGTLSITTDNITKVMVSANPSDKYQPYSNTTTPIYIGDDPLEKDEYVDYQAGKIYRMIDGTLTPIDPPVALPALPTREGTTIVDYAGSGTAPEKVYFEYKQKR